jgi:hypothetical protein
MIHSELDKYTNVLEGREEDLVQQVRNGDGIVTEKSPDGFDELLHATDRSNSLRLRSR